MKKNTSLKCFIVITILLNTTILSKNSIQTNYNKVKATNPNLTSTNSLVNFVGNWSNLETLPANGRHYTNYTINQDIELFDSPTFELEGNGRLMFNLTKYGYEINMSRECALLFHWMDFGALNDATYIGVGMRFKIDTGKIIWIYVAKAYSSSGYTNSTTIVLKFANPMIELGIYWEQWGIKMDPFFDFFQTSSMTLITISYIHQSTISYNGPRFVRYSQPLITDELPRSSESQGAFLGIYNEFWSQNMSTLSNWSQLNDDPKFDPDGDERVFDYDIEIDDSIEPLGWTPANYSTRIGYWEYEYDIYRRAGLYRLEPALKSSNWEFMTKIQFDPSYQGEIYSSGCDMRICIYNENFEPMFSA